ncbi:Hypothetical predicted protein [Podarcis lilfordi]|uniref:Uncharacterized protein n=1 Tax=Podarcis lilfordi TaxID=74358 RepID=A0AA35KIV0_9SAUR|nr:Hypothetical predicted protein [Podarcis lilfordi]
MPMPGSNPGPFCFCPDPPLGPPSYIPPSALFPLEKGKDGGRIGSFLLFLFLLDKIIYILKKQPVQPRLEGNYPPRATVARKRQEGRSKRAPLSRGSRKQPEHRCALRIGELAAGSPSLAPQRRELRGLQGIRKAGWRDPEEAEKKLTCQEEEEEEGKSGLRSPRLLHCAPQSMAQSLAGRRRRQPVRASARAHGGPAPWR